MTTSYQLQARALLKLRGVSEYWPSQFLSDRSGSPYIIQNEQVKQFINCWEPRYLLLKGGEGGGKSAAGIIKTLNRLKAGMNGIMISPDLEHFKKSLWKTFKEWCPVDAVLESQQYRLGEGWEPRQAFTMVFKNDLGGFSELICGGAKEDQIGSWEGPNVNFCHFDEARRHKTSQALKTLDGRLRITGPLGQPPQLYFTTTPRKHWLFEYFAGAAGDEESKKLLTREMEQKHADFKADAFVATVLTSENPEIDPEFVRQRAQTLTESEKRILLQAAWEDEADIEKFVNLIWWDACKETLPPLGRSEPVVIALDAATGSDNVSYLADCFSMVAVSRHPARKADVAVRYCGIWIPPQGQYLDFDPIIDELKRLLQQFSVLEVAYDEYQLHQLATQLKKAKIANMQKFPQGADRLRSDKGLQDLIMSRRIAHDGNPLLREHIDNADIKKSGEDGIRIVKRSAAQKVDAAVALSMASARILYFNL